jgi:hypothetical protein
MAVSTAGIAEPMPLADAQELASLLQTLDRAFSTEFGLSMIKAAPAVPLARRQHPGSALVGLGRRAPAQRWCLPLIRQVHPARQPALYGVVALGGQLPRSRPQCSGRLAGRPTILGYCRCGRYGSGVIAGGSESA